MMHRLGLASLRNRRFVFLLNVQKVLYNWESLLHDMGLKPRTHNIRDHNIFYLNKRSYFSRRSNYRPTNSLCNHSDTFNVIKISIANFTKIKFVNRLTFWIICKLYSATLDILAKHMFSESAFPITLHVHQNLKTQLLWHIPIN